MIVSDSVYVLINKKNLFFYKNLGYDPVIGTNLSVKVSDLSHGSNIKIIAKCDFCGNDKEISYKNYNKSLKSGSKYSCSQKCSYQKKSNILFETDGIHNIFQSDEIKEKIKRNNLEKFGTNYYTQTDEFKEKSKKTFLTKFGFDNPMKAEEIKERSKNTNLEKWGGIGFASNELNKKAKSTSLDKWGSEIPSQLDEIKDKIKTTTLERWGGVGYQSDKILEKVKETIFKRYGSDSNTKNEDFRRKYYDISKDPEYIEYSGDRYSTFNCVKGHTFSIHKDNYFSRKSSGVNICTVCNPIGESSSIKEKDILEFIESFGFNTIRSYRDSMEIDIYLPDLNLGFEFNGLYFHSTAFKEKDYHLNKLNYFSERGIRIINIWEDDWDFKRDIVKSQIRNFLGLSSRIFARKCEVSEISNTDLMSFLDINHIQGSYNGSKFCIGLFYKNELVSAMSFDKFEGRKIMCDGEWNLSRFCNKLGFSVVGGSSKLLSYFIKIKSPTRIISYADRNWSNGNLYDVLGFKRLYDTKPDYKYLFKGRRIHKSNFRRSKTGISEKNLNLHKVWDCGKIKYQKLLV